MSTIGFIGLGNMGFPMASRLADAGHRLIVNDRDQGAVQRFLDEHPAPGPPQTPPPGRTPMSSSRCFPTPTSSKECSQTGSPRQRP